jgi:hypothetical protein
LGQNLPEQPLQFRAVPLTAAQLEQLLADRLGLRDLEFLIEGRICRQDPIATVQNQQRLPDGIDDVQRVTVGSLS